MLKKICITLILLSLVFVGYSFSQEEEKGEKKGEKKDRFEENFKRAVKFFEKKDFKQAEAELKQILIVDEGHHPALCLLGKICLIQEKYVMAKTYFKKAVKFKKTYLEAYFGLIKALMHLGDYKEIGTYLKKAFTVAPNNPQILCWLARYYLLMGKGKKESVKKAEKLIKKALATDPNNYLVHMEYGRFYLVQKKYADAASSLLTAVQLNKKCDEAHYLLGMAYLGQRDLSKAIGSFNQALKLEPEYFHASLNKAKALMAQSSWNNAKNVLEAVIKDSNKYSRNQIAEAKLEIAKAYYSLGEKQKAIAALKYVVSKTGGKNPLNKKAKELLKKYK